MLNRWWIKLIMNEIGLGKMQYDVKNIRILIFNLYIFKKMKTRIENLQTKLVIEKDLKSNLQKGQTKKEDYEFISLYKILYNPLYYL